MSVIHSVVVSGRSRLRPVLMKMCIRDRRYIDESRKENLDSAMEFYRKGVEQGIFRNDVNYNIVRAMVCEQMDLLLHSEICKSYSLGEIYETVVFMHMRGISTEKGLKIVDNFLLNLKGNEHNKYG